MAVRSIETKVLECITKQCKDPRIDLLLVSAPDYAELYRDIRRASDVVQVLSECLQRQITISISTALTPGKFKWTSKAKVFGEEKNVN